MVKPSRLAPADVPGLAARRVAAELLDGVLHRGRALDEQLEGVNPAFHSLPERDRALTRNLAATVLRRLGSLRYVIGGFLDKGMPDDAPRLESALLLGAAQILFLEVPDHAAVDLSVRLVQADRRAARYTGLVNAVLRRVTQNGRDCLAEADSTTLDTPDWLLSRWTRDYGDDVGHAIAKACAQEPSLDLTVKADAESWAARLRGRVLPTGTIRTVAHGAVTLLPGFAEGAWWVQDAAAAIPARLIGDVTGLRVADLCAAPGGKTAQLAHAGANVTAVDRSAPRMARLADNMRRLNLAVDTVVADVAEWQSEPFDAILLDAPCSSTGTIRRHPDISWRKSATDLTSLALAQAKLLDRATDLLKPGGTLIYCVCSLEPEEGEQAIEAVLARDPRLRRRPIDANEIAGIEGFGTPAGDLRTLPCHWPAEEPRMAGLDGFFAARLQRV